MVLITPLETHHVAPPKPNINVSRETFVMVQLEQAEETQLKSLGVFKLTAYCSCSKCCGTWSTKRPKDENGNYIVIGASGNVLKQNYSIAVDNRIIPYGTHVNINGHIYRADDCGGAIKNNRIDIYFENHKDALKFGVQESEVFIYERN